MLGIVGCKVLAEIGRMKCKKSENKVLGIISPLALRCPQLSTSLSFVFAGRKTSL